MKKYDVSAVAELSMLHFDECETENMEAGFNEIMKLVEMLDDVDPECLSGNCSDNIRDRAFRDDKTVSYIDPTEMLECTAYKNGRYIVVPTVVEEE